MYNSGGKTEEITLGRERPPNGDVESQYHLLKS